MGIALLPPLAPNRLAQVCFVLALGCAPMQRNETRTVLAAGSQPHESCRWIPRLGAVRQDGGIGVFVAEQLICRNSQVERRRVRVDSRTKPNETIFLLEATATAVGGILLVNALACESEPDQDFECMGPAIGGVIGASILVPAGIATAVDVFDFGSDTKDSTEITEVDIRRTIRETRPMAGVPIELSLSGGDTLRSTSDTNGRAWLSLSVEMGEQETIQGVLRAGKLKRSMRWSR